MFLKHLDTLRRQEPSQQHYFITIPWRQHPPGLQTGLPANGKGLSYRSAPGGQWQSLSALQNPQPWRGPREQSSGQAALSGALGLALCGCALRRGEQCPHVHRWAVQFEAQMTPNAGFQRVWPTWARLTSISLTQNQQRVCLIHKPRTPGGHLPEWASVDSITHSFSPPPSQKSAGLDGGEFLSPLFYCPLCQCWGHSLVQRRLVKEPDNPPVTRTLLRFCPNPSHPTGSLQQASTGTFESSWEPTAPPSTIP